MSEAGQSWPMWAHDCDGEYQHVGEKWWVEIHGLPDPVVPVTVTLVAADSPEGTHWGWIDANGDGEPGLIWAFRAAFDMQFPYGPKIEEEMGKGKVARLRICAREAATSPEG